MVERGAYSTHPVITTLDHPLYPLASGKEGILKPVLPYMVNSLSTRFNKPDEFCTVTLNL